MSATILVVDDSATTRSLVASYLAGWRDVEVLEAANGFEGLRLLPAGAVDLIVTDINMPDINGLELVSFIKNHPVYKTIPILVISTKSSEEDRQPIQEMEMVLS